MVLKDHDKMLEAAKLQAKMFNSLSRKKNNEYFYTFIGCETSNIIILITNYYLINNFLGGRFTKYGVEVVEFSMKDPDVYADTFNPMCDAFPTLVNCQTRDFGVEGTVQRKSILCILSQNIINEKIYLFLWWWFLVLFVVSIFVVASRVITILSPVYRREEILRRMRTKSKKDIIDDIKDHWNGLGAVGNWFILCQIGKNSNAYFFRQFLNELNREEVEVKIDQETQHPESSDNADSVETLVLENEDQETTPADETKPKSVEIDMPLYPITKQSYFS